MSFVELFRKLPIDLGQGEFRHSTKAKEIAWAHVPQAQNQETALDLGCGDGYWSEKMKTKGYAVTSIDIMNDEYPNEDADKPYVSMIEMDANKTLTFADETFDLVWSTEVIEHLTNYKKTLTEMDRILKPGGRVVLTTPNSFFWLHYLLKFFGMNNEDWQNSGHVQFFSLKDAKTFFPHTKVYGYFPYMLIKLCISWGIGFLSPSFVVIYEKK